MSDRFARLRTIAPHLNVLKADPKARVSYELMSDALTWSDELPPFDEEVRTEKSEFLDVAALRGVWRYRSSLIEGEPVEKHRAGWEEAQRLFPDWPGFLPERRSPSWKELFLTQKKKLEDAMDALDERINRQKRLAPATQRETV